MSYPMTVEEAIALPEWTGEVEIPPIPIPGDGIFMFSDEKGFAWTVDYANGQWVKVPAW